MEGPAGPLELDDAKLDAKLQEHGKLKSRAFFEGIGGLSEGCGKDGFWGLGLRGVLRGFGA